MNEFEVFTLALSATAIIVLPVAGLSIRMIIKWTKIEAKMTEVIDDIRKVTEEKERVHTVIFEQLKEDRKATDRRLRWLEEHLWRRGNESAVRNPQIGG